MVSYTFQELLTPLERTRRARKLAALSRQVRIEQFLLAEIMFIGNEHFRGLDFYLEEKRRDLTVRKRQSDSLTGPLVDWVEAKTCYTDDLARSLTGHGRANEYRDLLHTDVQKQARGFQTLPAGDRGTLLTSLLFAIQENKPDSRHKFHALFGNRGHHAPSAIEEAACEHVRKVIAPFIEREVVEDFWVQLDGACRLHVFVFRAAKDATGAGKVANK
jgi:hypothetical protein